MAILQVFKATFPSISYIFKDGTPAYFVRGMYCTDEESKIAELKAEIAKKHPHIYIDPNQTQIESENLDPMNALRNRIIAEYEAEKQKHAGNVHRDLGNSDQSQVTPASTVDFAAIIGGQPRLIPMAGSPARVVTPAAQASQAPASKK